MLDRSATTRAILVASAGWAMLPKITSSISAGSTVERARASEAAMRPSSLAGIRRKAPQALTNGVRAPAKMTAALGMGPGLLFGSHVRGVVRPGSDSVLAQAVLLQLLVKVAARGIDRFRGGGDVPVVLLELLHQKL